MSDSRARDEAIDSAPPGRNAEQDEQIAQLRDNGSSWLEIQQRFGLSRQQARYAYQRGKREQRRAQRRPR